VATHLSLGRPAAAPIGDKRTAPGIRAYSFPVTPERARGGAPVASLVIPTRNEANNVQPLVDRVTAALGATPFEICFVDDSDDNTGDLLLELAHSNANVRCLLRQGADRTGGLSTAVVAGLRMARGMYVCVMDADLQHPPELIPVLLAEAEHGADLVVASRYAPGGSHEGLGTPVRRLVSREATSLARMLFKEARQSSDPLSGYFLCRRALIDGIEFRPVGFKILLELLVCVPDLRVVDVPVTQGPRAEGVSKATARQGLLYLRHLRSLFFDVPGSARTWKFGLVGFSGLCVFIPVLAILSAVGLNPLLAFIPAFGLSAAWNTALNWRLTFGDQRRGGQGSRHYLEFALLSGCVMFCAFAVLVDIGVPGVLSGLAAALVAMLLNGLVNRAYLHHSPSKWAAIAVDHGVQGGLARLAGEVGADRAYLLPARGDASSGLPEGLLAYVIAHRRPVLFTEAASYRAQRRSNIETASRMLLPVVRDDRVVAIVVCERFAPGGFEAAALDTATVAVAAIEPLLTAASSEQQERPEVAPARAAPGTAR
jgi:dolichol-phosphate mannosyltransferase